MPSPGCTFWAQLQAAQEVPSPAGAASELASEAGSLGAVCTAAAWTRFKQELTFQKAHAQDEWLQGATGIMYLLEGVKVNMYQNSITHTNRGKEGWLNM